MQIDMAYSKTDWRTWKRW